MRTLLQVCSRALLYILVTRLSELQDIKNSLNREEKVAEVKAKLVAGMCDGCYIVLRVHMSSFWAGLVLESHLTPFTSTLLHRHVSGVASEDLQALNKAMAMAIELGCENDADVQVA